MTQLRRNLRKRPLLIVVVYFAAPLGAGASFSSSFTFESYNEIGLQRRPGENSERECSLSVPHSPPPNLLTLPYKVIFSASSNSSIDGSAGTFSTWKQASVTYLLLDLYPKVKGNLVTRGSAFFATSFDFFPSLNDTRLSGAAWA
jgi:hypothetical protein